MAIPVSKYKNISFSSQFRYERIHMKGSVSYSLGTDPFYNTTTITIAHNLGYIPYFRIFIQFPGSLRIYQIETGSGSYGLVGANQVEGIGADATNVYVEASSFAASAGIGKIYYRIYAEPQTA